LVPIGELPASRGIPALVDLLPDFLSAKDEDVVSLLEQPEIHGVRFLSRYCRAESSNVEVAA